MYHLLKENWGHFVSGTELSCKLRDLTIVRHSEVLNLPLKWPYPQLSWAGGSTGTTPPRRWIYQARLPASGRFFSMPAAEFKESVAATESEVTNLLCGIPAPVGGREQVGSKCSTDKTSVKQIRVKKDRFSTFIIRHSLPA